MPDVPCSISTRGRHFVDSSGRALQLRGINVGGGSKVPTLPSAYLPLDRHAEVTYVDRPFPLEEAPEHFARLQSWGFNFLRITVTWEAIEHAGHGEYDQDYLTYLRSLLSLLPSYDLTAFVVFHQDVFSRLSGGSGAPGWTLEAMGFDLSNDAKALETCEAAYLGGVREGGERDEDRGRWPTGYQKLVCSTMNTAFWAGDRFMPCVRLQRRKEDGSQEEVGIQAYLQDAFLGAYGALVDAVGELEGVVGFEMLNEPHPGYIGLPSLHSFNYRTDLHLHLSPSALQSMALGAGHSAIVPHYSRSWPFPTRRTKDVLVNSAGKKVWRDDGPTKGKCVWETMGVWGWDEKKKEGVVLREKYFTRDDETGKEVDFYKDFYFPFVKRWGDAVQSSIGTSKFLLVEAVPNEWAPTWPEEDRPVNMIYAPHWYDLKSLFNKTFGFMSVNVQGLARGKFLPLCLYFGADGARKNYTLQLSNILEKGYEAIGERPQVLGELGIPMDLNGKEAFRTGDFSWQRTMMDALMSGLERNLSNFTLWTYNPANSDELGDTWNGENFSFYSQARAIQEREVALKGGKTEEGAVSRGWYNFGGRLLDVVVRPYPIALVGIPLTSTFSSATKTYRLSFAIPSISHTPLSSLSSTTTLIHLPSLHYGALAGLPPSAILLHSSQNGKFKWDKDSQVLYHDGPARLQDDWSKGEITIEIKGREAEVVWQRRKLAFAVVSATVGVLWMSEGLREGLRALLVWIWSWIVAFIRG